MPNTSPEKRKVLDANRYKKRKEKAAEFLGGKCAKCASTEELQFDHIDPKTKSFIITRKLGGGKWELIEAELKKCQLLCRPCHKKKTVRERGGPARGTHGTLSSYRYCKCELCRKAKNDWTREYRKRVGRRDYKRR